MESGAAHPTDKDQLRREALARRGAMTAQERAARNAAIHARLYALAAYDKADLILLYADARGEVATDDICRDAQSKGKAVAYPRVSGEEMEFYTVHDVEELTAGYRGIREPRLLDGRAMQPLTEDDLGEGVLAIVPGSVFTRAGERIGYGGGYYDRFLSRHPALGKLGLCYETQIVDQIPVEAHDVRMDLVISELA